MSSGAVKESQIVNRVGLRVGVVAAVEHYARVISDEGQMAMQISEHGATVPTANNTDGVRIDTSKEEGHGATGT